VGLAPLEKRPPFHGAHPKRTSIFQAETDQSPVARDGQWPRTQVFQINDHLAGALVDGSLALG